MSPKGPDLVLAADIPYCKADILVFNCFYVKTYENVENRIEYLTDVVQWIEYTRQNNMASSRATYQLLGLL